MAVLRRHWKLAVLNALLVLFAVGACVYIVAQRRADAAPLEVSPLGAVDYCHLRELRDGTALTALDLASVGCTGQQAEAALTALQAWAKANGQRIEDAESNVRLTRRALAEAVRRVNVGPRDAQLLGRVPSIQQAVVAAENAQRALRDEAAGIAMASLSAGQAQMLRTAATNVDVPEALRYVAALSPEQKELARVSVRKGRPIMVAVPTAKVAYDAVLLNRQQRMEEVLAAEQRVLPLPPELAESTPAAQPVVGAPVQSVEGAVRQ